MISFDIKYQLTRGDFIMIWSVLFLFMLVKCTSDSSTPNGEIPNIIEPPPTATQTPTATPTIRASITPVPSWTPTFTPLPPLPPDQAAALVKELFETNGGCQLPCWWGITPGESFWDSTSQFFSTFASDIVFLGVGNSGSENFAIGIRVPNSLNKSYVYIYEKNNIISDIQFDPSSDEENFQFQLHQLFKGYGKPSEIYIYVLPPLSHPGSEYFYEFRLVLHFPDQHIIAFYSFKGQPRNDTVYVCSPTEVADSKSSGLREVVNQ
ncbi:MAG: hypothetical protein IH859_00845 [Chloroflexi bacterium]|nr:hypothetical protein [Chloroflexota bacterium]